MEGCSESRPIGACEGNSEWSIVFKMLPKLCPAAAGVKSKKEPRRVGSDPAGAPENTARSAIDTNQAMQKAPENSQHSPGAVPAVRSRAP